MRASGFSCPECGCEESEILDMWQTVGGSGDGREVTALVLACEECGWAWPASTGE